MKRDTHWPVPLLLQIIDSGYNRKAWHGPNLRQSLRGVSAEDAAWRPEPGRHNIWELSAHTLCLLMFSTTWLGSGWFVTRFVTKLVLDSALTACLLASSRMWE